MVRAWGQGPIALAILSRSAGFKIHVIQSVNGAVGLGIKLRNKQMRSRIIFLNH